MARVETCVNSQSEVRTGVPSIAAGLGAASSLTGYVLASDARGETVVGPARRIAIAIGSAVPSGKSGHFSSIAMSPADADTSEHHGSNHPE